MSVHRRVGLLLVDKPEGMTSHDVVGWARRALGTRRVGHAGTLDPLASGLLPVLAGSATRLARFLHGWPKSYVGVIRLGAESPTGDREAAPPIARPPRAPAPELLAAARDRLSGTYLQEPPAFSAKKIGGVPAHRFARRGAAPRLEPVPVTVHRLRLARGDPGSICFAARVSSGTYLRALARDLGRILGTGAYLERLRRTAIGPLRVRSAVPPQPGAHCERLPALLWEPADIPLPLPTVRIDAPSVSAFCGGMRVVTAEPRIEGPWGGPVRVLGPGGELVGIGETLDAETVQPRVVLACPAPEAPAQR